MTSAWEQRRAQRVARLRAELGAATLAAGLASVGAAAATPKPACATAERVWRHDSPELPRPPLPPPTHERLPRGDWFDLMAMED